MFIFKQRNLNNPRQTNALVFNILYAIWMFLTLVLQIKHKDRKIVVQLIGLIFAESVF